MNLLTLFKKILPYVKPFRFLLAATLLLTLLGSLLAQVNAIVLDRTVDAINALVGSPDFTWGQAARILTFVSIILLGKEGLRAAIPAWPDARCVDTTGAGDTFVGAFLYARTRGWDIHTCARFANAAGSIAVEHTGANAAIHSADQVLERMRG